LSNTLPSTKATPAVAFCFLLNQLLGREGWARERLARFEGQGFELRVPLPLFPALRFTIGAGGRIDEGGSEPAAVVTPAGIEGDSALAAELRYLARHLRPDLEEELSKLVGDVAAQRIGQAARGLMRWQADAAARMGDAFADYATDERGFFVRRIELDAFAARVRALADALEHLEKRLDALD
jgi:ubiquinone biosynthesis protein UbiJ